MHEESSRARVDHTTLCLPDRSCLLLIAAVADCSPIVVLSRRPFLPLQATTGGFWEAEADGRLATRVANVTVDDDAAEG